MGKYEDLRNYFVYFDQFKGNEKLKFREKQIKVVEMLKTNYLLIETEDSGEQKRERARDLVEIIAQFFFKKKKYKLPKSLEKVSRDKYIMSVGNLFVYLGIACSNKELRTLAILKFRRKLIELGFYSPVIQDLDCNIILNFKPSDKSYYLSQECPDLEKNKIIFRNFSVNYAKKILPQSVEEVSSDFPFKSNLWKSLEFVQSGKELRELPILSFKLKLVKLGFYSTRINDYDCKAILNFSASEESYYLSQECPDLEKNKIIFRNFLINYAKKILPQSIEEVSQNDKHRGKLWKNLGIVQNTREVKNLSILSFKTKLVELGFYSTIIKDYECKTILKFNTSEESYYLSQECPDLDKNKITFRNFLINYAKDILPKSVEELTNDYKYKGKLWKSLGVIQKSREARNLTLLKLKIKLIELGFYDSTIKDYDCSIILNFGPHQKSYYLSEECPNFQQNQNKLKTLPSFKNFLQGKMPDGEVASIRRIKSFLKKYELIDSHLSKNKKISSRMLSSKWSNELKEKLISMYNNNSNFVNDIKNSNLAHDEFGRSAQAVISQLYFLLGTNNKTGKSKEVTKKIISHFPHNKYFIAYLEVLTRYSQIPNVLFDEAFENNFKLYPIIVYNYPFNRQAINGESNLVFLLPIEYKGIHLLDYEEYNQIIIQHLQNQMIDINTNENVADKVNIFEARTYCKNEDKGLVFHPNYTLVGLYLKGKYSLNPVIKDRTRNDFVISFEDGTEKKLSLSFYSFQNKL